jgi:hypothetical protein
LAPKNSFIATEAVEGIIGQIAEPQETTCELNIGSNLTLEYWCVVRLECIRETGRPLAVEFDANART